MSLAKKALGGEKATPAATASAPAPKAAPASAPAPKAAPAAATPVAEASAPVEAAAPAPAPASDAAAADETPDDSATRRKSDLTRVSDLDDEHKAKLNAAGIFTCDELLEKGSTPAGRKEIAEAAGVDTKQALRWVNQVDLFRLDGVESKFANLLEAAGVDTIPELAQRNAVNLHEKLEAINAEQNIVQRMPSLTQVMDWVEQAGKLPRVINY
ncbi:MAG TPA: DUF4332 domain-containing protein [Blastocatellia bacterium]|nr:DUF4332 domain-containing protein [Blastocatellia bacterium]